MSGRIGSSQFSEPNIVTIGTQVWMLKNLDTVRYNNGDPIPEVQDATTWLSLTTGAWCWYNNSPINGSIYGRLYNQYVVLDPRGITPPGWHVPTQTDFNTLITFAGGATVAGGAIKQAGFTTWNSPNTGATNSTGFTSLGGGYRRNDTGAFNSINAFAGYWSSTSFIRFAMNNISAAAGTATVNSLPGFYIRCIKD